MKILLRIEYYQVAWNVGGEETMKREFGRLEYIKDNYPKYLLRERRRLRRSCKQ